MRSLRTIIFAILVIFLTAAVSHGQQRLLVVGGGERPPEAMKRFVEWCGGPEARVLIITWASGVPDESFEALKKNFDAAGSRSIEHAATRPLDTEKRARFVEQLASARCVFFSGGDQNRIMDVLADEPLLQAIKRRYADGVPFGGTSAGAAVMSDPMMTGEADLKVLDGSKVGVRKGLGLLPNVIFDQHFLVRQRHNRLFGLIIKDPKMLGIGIDEDTAVLIEDDRRLTVVGKSQVMFIHSKGNDAQLLVSFLRSGNKFDIAKRKAGSR